MTIPDHMRLLMNIEDGDYARITITETIKKRTVPSKKKKRSNDRYEVDFGIIDLRGGSSGAH